MTLLDPESIKLAAAALGIAAIIAYSLDLGIIERIRKLIKRVKWAVVAWRIRRKLD